MKKITLFLISLFVTSICFSQLTVEKLWEFSAASSNKPAWLPADDGRSMVIKDGKLYIMLRTLGKIQIIDTKAVDISVEVATPTSLNLTGYLTGSNCLSFTTDGQLLGGSYAAATLKISKIDLSTGVTTQLLEKNPAASIGRFDYFSSYGDFSSTGTGYILSTTCPSGGAGGFNTYKWNISNGVIDPAVFTTIVRPTVFGSSSIAVPVDANTYYAMSANTNPELIKMDGSITQFASVFPVQGAAAASGMCDFDLNGKKYFIRTDGRFGGMTFYDISGGVALATKLANTTAALGAVANSTVKTTIVTENISNAQVNVYILSPNNGIAAYKLKDVSTGTNNIQGQNARIIRTSTGVEINLDCESTIELYTVNGLLIDKTNASGIYSRDLNSGVYIIRINGKATKFVK